MHSYKISLGTQKFSNSDELKPLPNHARYEAEPFPHLFFEIKFFKKVCRASKKKFKENLLTLALFLEKFV